MRDREPANGAVAGDEPRAPAPGGTRRYARWQLRDALVARAPSVFAVLLFLFGIQLYSAGGAARGGDRAVQAALLGASASAAQLGALLAAANMSSWDRRFGFFRFLFSRPARVPHYYGQDFVLRALGSVAGAAAALLVVSLATGTAYALWALGLVALYVALLGSLTFLVGTIVSSEFVVLAMTAVALVGRLLWASAGGWRGTLATLLPPFDRIVLVRDAWIAHRPVPAGDLLWILAYAVGHYLSALLVLRRRPLAG